MRIVNISSIKEVMKEITYTYLYVRFIRKSKPYFLVKFRDEIKRKGITKEDKVKLWQEYVREYNKGYVILRV